MRNVRLRRVTSQALLGLAYITCVMQWLWVMIIGLPPLINSGAIDLLTVIPEEPTPVVTAQASEPNLLLWSLVGLTTIFMLILTFVVLIRLPRTVARTGEHVVRGTAEALLPVITHHKKLPAKKRVVLSQRLMLSIRLAACLLPFLISLFLPAPSELTPQIIRVVATSLAAVSLIGFGLAWAVEPVITSRTQSRASRG